MKIDVLPKMKNTKIWSSVKFEKSPQTKKLYAFTSIHMIHHVFTLLNSSIWTNFQCLGIAIQPNNVLYGLRDTMREELWMTICKTI